MRVEALTPGQVAAYDAYLLTQPASMLFQSSPYKNLLKDMLGCDETYLVAWEGDSICGVLPLMVGHSSTGDVYNALPYYGSNGGVLTGSMDAYAALVVAYNELACGDNTLAATLITNQLLPQDDNGILHDHISSRIGQFTDLRPLHGKDWDEVFNHFNPSIRWDVKKAIAKGVQVQVDYGQMDRLREMHQDNMRSIGAPPKSDAFFAAVVRNFREGEYRLYTATLEGKVISALLLFYFNRTVEYYVPAIDAEYRSYQPSSLAVIRAMADAAAEGYDWWNWGGTQPSQTGVYHFKKKWDGVDRPYTYFTHINNPALLEMSPEAIAATFPNFFVVPFSALKGASA
jgi:hypothetical protein